MVWLVAADRLAILTVDVTTPLQPFSCVVEIVETMQCLGSCWTKMEVASDNHVTISGPYRTIRAVKFILILLQ